MQSKTNGVLGEGVVDARVNETTQTISANRIAPDDVKAIIADLPYDPKYHESLVAEKDVVRCVLSYCLFVPSSHALHWLC